MDAGASFLASPCNDMMRNFKIGKFGKVRLCDDESLYIAHIRDVVLKTHLGTNWTMKNVRDIPGLKRVLISVGQLDNHGYHEDFIDGQWKVIKGNMLLIVVTNAEP